MLKSLTLLSVSAATLLATTQAYSHVLCAPNNPQLNVSHSHNQAYSVPRIQPVVRHVAARPAYNQQNQQHLQAQRARQQQALANQRRINQQRRAQAQRVQQQTAARKAQQIRQQQAAAQRARAARQQAAQRAAQSRQLAQRAVHRQPVQQAVYRQPVQRIVYQQPRPQPQRVVYQPAPQITYYQAPAPVRYVPARTSVSFQINTNRRVHNHARRHIRRVHQSRQVMRYPKQPRRMHHRVAKKRYHGRSHGHRNYQWNHK